MSESSSNAQDDAARKLSAAAIGAASLAIPLSLILFSYERALTPIYASVPTNELLDKFALLAIALPYLVSFKKQLKLQWKCFSAAIVLSLAPNATYWIGVWTARWRDPYWGPAVVHGTVLVPLIVALVNFVPGKPSTLVQSWPSYTGASISYFVAKVLSKKVWAVLPYMRNISDSKIYLALALLAFGFDIMLSDFSKLTTPQKSLAKGVKKRPIKPNNFSFYTKLTILACFSTLFWTLLYPVLRSPVLPHPFRQTYNHPNPGPIPLRILSSIESTTGLIVVGDVLPPSDKDLLNDSSSMHSVRYLRAAHSLLGGVWTGPRVMSIDNVPPVRDSKGVPLGDSVYGAFVLQEAARLVDSSKKDVFDNALIIGLGAGIAATSFHRHHMNLTIVEIDPAVYDAARRFFGLPDPGARNVFLQDARSWAAQQRADDHRNTRKTEDLYDIVVHDCFSGGGVPEHLYSIEFWEDLKSVIHPEGVVAVNIAGQLNSLSSRLVLRTLEEVFNGGCRAFYDSMDTLTEDQYEGDFLNVVIFCTPSMVPITFRPSNSADYLGSPLRRHILSTLPDREINLSLLRASAEDDHRSGLPSVITDANNPLGKLQEAHGAEHWNVMREVFPAVIWETF